MKQKVLVVLLTFCLLFTVNQVFGKISPNFTLLVGGDFRTISQFNIGEQIDSLAAVQVGNDDWRAIGHSIPYPFKDGNGKQLGYEVFALKILTSSGLIFVGGSFEGKFKGIAQFDTSLQMWDDMKGGLMSVTVKDLDFEQVSNRLYIAGYSYTDGKFTSNLSVWNVKEKKWEEFKLLDAPVEFNSAILRKVRVFSNKDGKFLLVSSETDLYIIDIQTRKCSLLIASKKNINDFLLEFDQNSNSVSIIIVGSFSIGQIQNSAKLQLTTSNLNLVQWKPFGLNNSIEINSIAFDSVNSKYYASRAKGSVISLNVAADESLISWNEFGNQIGYMAQIFTMDGDIFVGNSDCSSGHPFYRFNQDSNKWEEFLLTSIGKYENCLLNYWISTDSSIIFKNSSIIGNSSSNIGSDTSELVWIIIGSLGALTIVLTCLLVGLVLTLKVARQKNSSDETLQLVQH